MSQQELQELPLVGEWEQVLLQLAFTHTAVMHSIFESTHLSPLEWLKVLGAGLLVFAVAELEKFVIRRTPLASRVVQA